MGSPKSGAFGGKRIWRCPQVKPERARTSGQQCLCKACARAQAQCGAIGSKLLRYAGENEPARGGRRRGGVDEMMIDFIAAVGIAGTLSGIFFAVVGYKKGLQKESLTNGRESGTLKADTEYIKRRIDDVLLEQKDTNKSINALSERVTRVEESTKQAHKRIDEMKGEME